MERINKEILNRHAEAHAGNRTNISITDCARMAKELLAYRESRALEALKNYRFIDHETCVEKGGPIDMRCSACKVADAAIAKLEAINA